MGTRSYQDALHLLNTLQTNAATLEALKKSGQLNQRSLPEMTDYLRRLGYHTNDLSRLSIIHVAGTKGKGSTCAFCNSILSKMNPSLKIGLYTSPHLQQVRERIKISGVALKQEEFAEYFFQVWDKLDHQKVSLSFFNCQESFTG
jgi:folylpolyglutamate synthase